MSASKIIEIPVYQFFQSLPYTSYLIAVSGGVDSMALLHVLSLLQSRLGLDLHVCTVNHNTRPESHGDADWVQKQCEEYQIPCHVVEVHPNQKADLENHLRSLRYDTLYRVAKECNAEAILLGHHADDQVEGIIKRVLEGGRIKGMDPVSITDRGVLVRPLLGLSKKQLMDFLQTHKVSWREDRSNLDSAFTRNRIRHEIAPLLEEAFGKKISSNLIQLEKKQRQIEAHLDAEIEQAWNQVVQGDLQKGVEIASSGLDLLEVDHLLYRIFEKEKIPQNRFLRERVASHLVGSQGRHCHDYQGGTIIVQKGKLIIRPSTIPHAIAK